MAAERRKEKFLKIGLPEIYVPRVFADLAGSADFPVPAGEMIHMFRPDTENNTPKAGNFRGVFVDPDRNSYSCFTYLSSQPKNSRFQTIEFWGLNT